MRTRAHAVLAVMVAILFSGAPAAADPAGPTDYITTIDSIEPTTDAISVRMIGGDSFFEITQLRPVHIAITGYRGEPYLRIRANGAVEQNRLSPTTYLNEERYGAGDIIPAFADADAEPEWEQVATGGRYAWHDHRSHWMNPVKPPGRTAGDTILEAVIPITVDGEEIDVTVSSVLQAPPSPVGGLLGAVVAAAAVAAVLSTRLPALALPVAFAMVAVAVRAALSVPPEAGRPLTLWLPPLLAVGALIAAGVVRNRVQNPLVEVALVLAGATQFLLWAALQRMALVKPVLPTELPWDVHRFAVALAFVTGLGLVAAAALRIGALFTTPLNNSAG